LIVCPFSQSHRHRGVVPCAFCCPQGRFYSVLALFTETVTDSNLNKHLMFAFWPHLNTDKRAGSSFHSVRKSLVRNSTKCYNNICPMKLWGESEQPPREQSMKLLDCGNLQIAEMLWRSRGNNWIKLTFKDCP